MPSKQYPPIPINVSEAVHVQFFQAALPLFQRSSSSIFSRNVSIGCQKPSCLKAKICPSLANFSIGCRSQEILSSVTYSRTLGDKTKKPPLIQQPSPIGFSLKPVMASPAISSEPKRPSG